MSILEILSNVRDDVDFANSSNFIDDGLLDSFDIVTLVEEIEEQFDIEMKGSDIVPDNFVSVETIEKLVERYQN
ncbi:MAG: acyl carrier protein [Lachnospiraceae bacterium]|nr:acyl carrier protein [Lachnospiraceae bacterium]